MNNNPIGVFDSGVGGLSVFSELIKLMPDEKYIYFGDCANLPYGDKTKEELIKITDNIFGFFKTKNVKAVVMACNTTSATTYEILKDRYDFKIFPIVQSVSKRIALENHKKIGVFATKATINSQAYKREIAKYSPETEVFELACPNWVKIVENRLQTHSESIEDMRNKVDVMLKNNVEKIILGCTHYPYLLDELKSIAKKDIFVNPAQYFACDICQSLKQNNLLSGTNEAKREFYVSSNAEQFKKASKLFYEVQDVTVTDISATMVK